MDRRAFMKNTVGAGLMLGVGSRLWAAESQKRLPNIVILYADDMGYGDLGIQNRQSKIPTPNLDQLARDGLRFTDAHSSSGICTPSRYAMLTGRYHWRKFHEIVNAFGASVFSKDRLTLAGMLKSKGYATACIGKWHLGWDWNAIRTKPKTADQKDFACDEFDWSKRIPDGPCDHGFDTYFGDDVPNFPPYTWIENDHVLIEPTKAYSPNPVPKEGKPEGRPGPMAKGWRQDQVMPTLTEKAVEWVGMQKGQDRPFFLYFPFTSPHAPILPAAQFEGKSHAGPYGDYVYESDWAAGQVLAALDANGFRDNTIVIFTSDNGPEHYAYERVRKYKHRSMGPFRGVKRDTWEGGHREPFIVRWPGVVAPGGVSDALISQIDIMATLASVVGYQLPRTAAEDSYDQLSVWKGGAGARPVRHTLIHNTRKDKYVMRDGDWVYFNSRSGQESRAPKWYDDSQGYTRNPLDTALYNLRTDLAEQTNVITEHPEKAAQLANELEQIRQQGCSAPRLCCQK